MRASVLVFAALASCATVGTPVGTPTYYERVVARVEFAQEQTRFEVRHNPVECDCPPFEVKLGKAWQRVEFVALEGEDEPVVSEIARMLEQAEAAGRTLSNLQVMGRLEPEVERCGRGALYVSLVPMEVEVGP